jgi:hypothetical protein
VYGDVFVIEAVDNLRQGKDAQREPIAGAATDSGKPPYQPSKTEIASPRAPSLKLKPKGDSKGSPSEFAVDPPHELIGRLDLVRAVGTTDEGFFGGLMRQLTNASGKTSETDANFLLSVIKGIEPRDQIGAMLAAQMTAVHEASMTYGSTLSAS